MEKINQGRGLGIRVDQCIAAPLGHPPLMITMMMMMMVDVDDEAQRNFVLPKKSQDDHDDGTFIAVNRFLGPIY